MTDSVTPAADAPEAPQAAPAAAKRPAKPDVFPVLEKLAALYPQLFGAEFLPLKRGIFQDLQELHAAEFERELLKAALAFHTRSTRYLTAVASGLARHDLQGAVVEPMAPEHVHHALVEVFRRRQMRTQEDLRPKLVARMVRAMEASGLAPGAYADVVRNKDEAANAALEEARVEVEARAAKTEALQRAFQASGKTAAEFADMYGLDAAAMRRLQLSASAATA
jgi:ProP effector